MNNQKSTTSWTIIIVMLIIFWPIGLILLFSKLANDRTASFGGGAGLIKFVGVVLIFFAVMFLFTLASGDSSAATGGIILAILLGLPGVWLLKKSKSMKAVGNKNRMYIDYIINNKVHDVHELARRMGVSQDVVISDVNLMINNGMLGRARLNLNNGRIEFAKPKPRPEQRPQQQTFNRTESSPHRDTRSTHQPKPQQPIRSFSPKTIRCTGCSANNFVESLPAQCEYCGTSLHDK